MPVRDMDRDERLKERFVDRVLLFCGHEGSISTL